MVRRIALVSWLCTLTGISAAAPWRFVVTGDSRPEWGDPVPVTSTFTEIIRQVNALDPPALAVVHTGDIVLGCTVDRDFLKDEFDAFLAARKTLRPPLYVAVGNHEDYDAVSQAMFVDRVGPLYYSVTIGGSAFFFLDDVSHAPDRYAKFDEQELAWLDAGLAAAAGAEHRFVSFHVPICASTYKDWMEVKPPVSDRIMKICESRSVTAVFQGHVHVYDETERNGVRYFITGGGGAGLDAEGEQHHYLLVTVDGPSVRYERKILSEPPAEPARKWVEPARVVKSGEIVEAWPSGPGEWSPWNKLVTLEPLPAAETRQGLRLAFRAARSLWPMMSWEMTRVLDLRAAKGLKLDVRLVPVKLVHGATIWVKPTVGDRNGASRDGAAVQVKAGKWQTLRFPFKADIWLGKDSDGKKGKVGRPLDPKDLDRVTTISFSVEVREPGKDWAEISSEAAVDFASLRAL